MRNAAQIEADLQAALLEAEAAQQLPLSDRTRGANILLSHKHLLKAVPEFLASIHGQQDTIKKLITLVASLLEICSPNADGSLDWVKAIPPGKAAQARRLLNELEVMMGREFKNG